MKHLIIITLLALVACKSPEEIAKAEIAECQALGVAPKDIPQCRLQLRAMATQKSLAAAAWARPMPVYKAY
jgi:hypothetical protein